jgi:uncharacterized protein (DUF1697 family)
MPVYTALLRGINIGPHKRMKMEKLRTCCEAVGVSKVKTLLHSGNVVFQTGKLSPVSLGKKIEQQIAADFGFSVDVILRSREELGQIIDKNPLLKARDTDPSQLHVVFLGKVPSPAAIQELQRLTLLPDKTRIAGKEIYFCFPNGVSGSSLWKHPLDRVLFVPATMRNWNTVNKLYEMAVACG